MLNIKIDNPELEREIKQSFGDDNQSLANAFADFLHQYQVRQDIAVSITRLEQGQGLSMDQAIAEGRACMTVSQSCFTG